MSTLYWFSVSFDVYLKAIFLEKSIFVCLQRRLVTVLANVLTQRMLTSKNLIIVWFVLRDWKRTRVCLSGVNQTLRGIELVPRFVQASIWTSEQNIRIKRSKPQAVTQVFKPTHMQIHTVVSTARSDTSIPSGLNAFRFGFKRRLYCFNTVYSQIYVVRYLQLKFLHIQNSYRNFNIFRSFHNTRL